MKRILPAIALCLLGTAAVARSAAPEAVFKLEPYRKTVALRASVAGHSGLFVFDTAGGITLLAPAFGGLERAMIWDLPALPADSGPGLISLRVLFTSARSE